MAQFMLLLYDNPDDYVDLSPEEMQSVVRDYGQWAKKMGQEGRLAAGEKLADDAGRRIVSRKGRVTVTDGPFAETKEVLGGFFIIKAKDYDEAIEIAKSCPHMKWGCRTDVRQIDHV